MDPTIEGFGCVEPRSGISKQRVLRSHDSQGNGIVRIDFVQSEKTRILRICRWTNVHLF